MHMIVDDSGGPWGGGCIIDACGGGQGSWVGATLLMPVVVGIVVHGVRVVAALLMLGVGVMRWWWLLTQVMVVSIGGLTMGWWWWFASSTQGMVVDIGGGHALDAGGGSSKGWWPRCQCRRSSLLSSR